MKYGEKYETALVDRFTKKRFPCVITYKYAEWNGYNTDNRGDGLWCGDKQVVGTCDFTVRGCKTEKAAKAKIRKLVTTYHTYWEEDYCMHLKEWNLCLDYVDFECAEFPNITYSEYTMYDGRKGVAFHSIDRNGNVYETVYSGICSSFEEMKHATQRCLKKLLVNEPII